MRSFNGIVASQTFNADNQKTASGTFVYDGNGNPTTYAGGTLTFDPMDKMLSIASSGTGSYRYRADGLRAWKGWNVTIPTTSGIPVTGATYFLYDGGNPVAEMDSSGTVTAVNVFAHDGLVARVEGSTTKYYQFDAQGSVAHRTNSSGSVTSSSKYEAYGKHVNIPGSTVDTYGWNGRWGYYYDTDSGLYLCQQRYYDANQGRWLNRDPIGYGGGVNLYGYCGGSPVGWHDKIGLVRIVAYWYEVGSGIVPLGIPGITPVITVRVVGYHVGLAVYDNMGRGKTRLYAGGPERYGNGNWGKLIDKGGVVGDGSQDDGKHNGLGVVLVDDDSLAGPWNDCLSSISMFMDRTVDYGFPEPNSNSWSGTIIRQMGLNDAWNHARGKRWPLPDPWAPGMDRDLIR